LKQRIIFTVSNAPGTVYKFKEFRNLGYTVIGLDANPNAVGRHFADEFRLVPYQKSKDYISTLLKIIKETHADILVGEEGESLRLNEIKQQIEELGCTLVATDSNTLTKSLDKVHLFTFLKANTDIPLPQFCEVNSLEEFNQGLMSMKSDKICIKPARSSGSRGVIILENDIPDCEALFTKKMSFAEMSYTNFREVLKKSKKIPKLIMMEYLDDVNYDSNIVCRNGEILFQSVKTREEAKIGTITQGTIIEHPEIELINHKIAASLKTTGLVSPQFIGNKLIEINPRWSTSLNFGSINEYLFGVQVFTNEEIRVDPEDRKNYPGLSMTRYWDVIIYK
jgi:carbamoylphosphate synthase large subunit